MSCYTNQQSFGLFYENHKNIESFETDEYLMTSGNWNNLNKKAKKLEIKLKISLEHGLIYRYNL